VSESAKVTPATSGLECVAVDFIALNYLGNHKREMTIRGIQQESNQQQELLDEFIVLIQ